jgi:hypothetical protein
LLKALDWADYEAEGVDGEEAKSEIHKEGDRETLNINH